MAYVVVMLHGGGNTDDERLHADEHERFIDSLISRNLVLLGGGFANPIGDAWAAYVLCCSDIDEARRITEKDPFVAHGVLRPELTEWRLVGINPEAIDAAAVVRPRDV
jgi:uncharacterized protein YciI